MSRITKKIKQLIPFVSDDFMTFPLSEEGDFRPTISFWQLYKSKDCIPYLDNFTINDIYVIVEIKENLHNYYCVTYSLSNNTDPTKHSKYNLKKMLNLATKIIDLKSLIKKD